MYTFNLDEYTSYSLITLFFLFLWYQGIFLAIISFNIKFLCLIFPIPLLFSILYNLNCLISYTLRLFFLAKKRFYFNYYDSYLWGENFLKNLIKVYSKKVDNLPYTPKIDVLRWLIYVKFYPIFKNFLGKLVIFFFKNYNLPSKLKLLFNNFMHSIYTLLTIDTLQVLTEYPEIFLRKAMFCNTVTFWLFIFYYRVFMGLEIQPKKVTKKPLLNLWFFLSKKALSIYNNNRVSLKTRQYFWNFLNEDFYKSFFFVKRFKKLNDLIWQDGFLIDFLQKKVVDKWIRGFVIFSGNLFSERLLFDNVVRFYIDSIFRSISSITIYEFNSASSILLVNLQLLLVIFLLVFLIFIGLFIL